MDIVLRAPVSVHNTLLRRLRRRIAIPPWWVLGLYVSGQFPVLCVLAWLSRGQSDWWLVEVARWLWLVSALPFGAISVFALLVLRDRVSGDARRWMPFQLTSFVIVIVALLLNRLEYAALGQFTAWAGLFNEQKRTLNLPETLSSAAGSILVVIGAFSGSFAIALVGAILSLSIPSRILPLQTVARRKPDKAEYVSRQQEKCSAGGG